MPHQFRTLNQRVWKASQRITLFRADGSELEAIWGGSAREERLGWWLKKPRHELAQTECVAGVAVKDEDTDELRWGETPERTRLFFVVEPSVTGKSGGEYRIAKLVTTASTPEQRAFFNDERFALLGSFQVDGSIATVPPLVPPPLPLARSELF